jgi:hypothetical protein
MVGVDDLVESQLLAGVAVAAGVLILAPIALPVVLGVARPLVKTAVKTGIVLYERGLEAAAEVSEAFEDIVAEAKSELNNGAVPAGTGPAGTEGLEAAAAEGTAAGAAEGMTKGAAEGAAAAAAG